VLPAAAANGGLLSSIPAFPLGLLPFLLLPGQVHQCKRSRTSAPVDRAAGPLGPAADITVLDAELRVCRGNAGTLFALLCRDDLRLEE